VGLSVRLISDGTLRAVHEARRAASPTRRSSRGVSGLCSIISSWDARSTTSRPSSS
jgi:hypothetical protein